MEDVGARRSWPWEFEALGYVTSFPTLTFGCATAVSFMRSLGK